MSSNDAAPDSPSGDGPPTLATTRVTSAATTGDRSGGRHAALAPAAERGQLTIADVVVEKVATAAAGEVDDVGGAARRVLGVKTGDDDADGRPRASARVTGETVALELRLSIAYPASVRRTTEAVSAHVRDRVHTMTALTVTRVDIAVAALTSEQPGPKRVVS